ncbi:hypothetical protein RRG08_015130 [Elysia crispata]|uniref:Uncharacterized protein n=1 Tax=Elysia crispata TaxID=231223 RepID=A0AAE1AB77_9GAST|nr:hypothetical protein RRG08_015130 [Elysia crispata]
MKSNYQREEKHSNSKTGQPKNTREKDCNHGHSHPGCKALFIEEEEKEELEERSTKCREKKASEAGRQVRRRTSPVLKEGKTSKGLF